MNELEGQVKEWQKRHEEAVEDHHREMEVREQSTHTDTHTTLSVSLKEMRRATTELQSSLRYCYCNHMLTQ